MYTTLSRPTQSCISFGSIVSFYWYAQAMTSMFLLCLFSSPLHFISFVLSLIMSIYHVFLFHSLSSPTSRPLWIDSLLTDVANQNLGFKAVGVLNGTAFKFSDEGKTWFAAEKHCKSIGARLAILDTKELNDFILARIKHDTRVYWIGGSDRNKEGHWLWVNGMKMELGQAVESDVYQNWGKAEPNGNTIENCLNVFPEGKWNDGHCNDVCHYICEQVQKSCSIKRSLHRIKAQTPKK